MKFTGQFALIKYLSVAYTQMQFLLKTVDHTLSTSFNNHLIFTYVIVVQTEYGANNAMTKQLIHKSICAHMYFKGIQVVYSLYKH